MSITNYDGLLEAMAGNCKDMYENIAKVNNAYDDSVVEAYTRTLPSKYADILGIKKIGGKTIVWNQIYPYDFSSTTGLSEVGNCTISVSDNVLTMTVDGSQTIAYCGTAYSDDPMFEKSHVFYVSADIHNNIEGAIANVGLYGVDTVVDSVNYPVPTSTGFVHQQKICKGATAGKDGRKRINVNTISNAGTVQVKNFFICDLTAMFGAGNEPQTCAAFEAMFPAVWYEFNKGTLLNAGVTDIVSKNKNNDVMQTYSIPEDITTLEGYGWSCPGAYNYIDFDTKKFVYAVGTRAYEAGDESDSTVITDGTNTHYELDEPLEFDVELPDETITEAEAGGSLTFANQHGDDYCIPVPVGIEMIGVS